MPDTRRLTRSEVARVAARARWGDSPRVVRLTDMLPEERAVITALLALKRRREELQADKAAA